MRVGTIRQMTQQAKANGLPVSEGALRRWIKSGDLRCVYSGNRAYLSWQDILSLLGVKEGGESIDA